MDKASAHGARGACRLKSCRVSFNTSLWNKDRIGELLIKSSKKHTVRCAKGKQQQPKRWKHTWHHGNCKKQILNNNAGARHENFRIWPLVNATHPRGQTFIRSLRGSSAAEVCHQQWASALWKPTGTLHRALRQVCTHSSCFTILIDLHFAILQNDSIDSILQSIRSIFDFATLLDSPDPSTYQFCINKCQTNMYKHVYMCKHI